MPVISIRTPCGHDLSPASAARGETVAVHLTAAELVPALRGLFDTPVQCLDGQLAYERLADAYEALVGDSWV